VDLNFYKLSGAIVLTLAGRQLPAPPTSLNDYQHILVRDIQRTIKLSILWSIAIQSRLGRSVQAKVKITAILNARSKKSYLDRLLIL